MAAPYVTAEEILLHVGNVDSPPTDADADWADLCAASIEASIATRLADVTIGTELEAELRPAAITDGAAMYVSRRAPHGILSVGPDGDVARLGASFIRSLEPIFLRFAGPGIG